LLERDALQQSAHPKGDDDRTDLAVDDQVAVHTADDEARRDRDDHGHDRGVVVGHDELRHESRGQAEDCGEGQVELPDAEDDHERNGQEHEGLLTGDDRLNGARGWKDVGRGDREPDDHRRPDE